MPTILQPHLPRPPPWQRFSSPVQTRDGRRSGFEFECAAGLRYREGWLRGDLPGASLSMNRYLFVLLSMAVVIAAPIFLRPEESARTSDYAERDRLVVITPHVETI